MASHRSHRGRAGRGRDLRDPERRWRGAPPQTAEHFWAWVLTRLSVDEAAAVRAWWLTNMAKHNPTAAWSASGGGRRGTWTGQEPELISSRHWSIRGAETPDDFRCGVHLRRMAATAECGDVGHTDLQAAELKTLISVLSANAGLRSGFMAACREGGERRAVAWLVAQIRDVQV